LICAESGTYLLVGYMSLSYQQLESVKICIENLVVNIYTMCLS